MGGWGDGSCSLCSGEMIQTINVLLVSRLSDLSDSCVIGSGWSLASSLGFRSPDLLVDAVISGGNPKGREGGVNRV